MRATKAYIASLGTTGVLLAASILMLAVVSAVVAFDRWPGGNPAAPVKTLVLSDKAPAIRVSAHALGSSATPRHDATAIRGAGQQVTRTPSLAVGERTTGGAGTPAPATPVHTGPALPGAVTKPLQPVEETTTPIFETISNPGTTAGRLADQAQTVTTDAGVSVGRVAPDVGTAVVGTGDS